MTTAPEQYEGYQRAIFDPYHAYVNHLFDMADMAEAARNKEAESSRGILVGSSLLAYNAILKQVKFLSAGNFSKLGEPGYCAEMKVLDMMDDCNSELELESKKDNKLYGKYEPIGIVTIATSDKKLIAEATPHKPTDTLCMCEACDRKYDNHPKVNPSNFVVTTMGEDMEKYQVYTLEQAKALELAPNSTSVKQILCIEQFMNWEDLSQNYEQMIASTDDSSSDARAQFAVLALRGAPQRTHARDIPVGCFRPLALVTS